MQAPRDTAAVPSPQAKIWSIPPGRPFLTDLAEAVLAGTFSGGTPPTQTALPDITIYLPGRTAAETLRREFVRLSPNRATLLPAIRILGVETDWPPLPPLPNAPGDLERRLILTRLILDVLKERIGGPEGEEQLFPHLSPAEAYAMAGTLADLFDEIETDEQEIGALLRLRGMEGSDRQQLSRRLLLAVTRGWQAFLRREGLIGPAARRNLLLRAEGERIAAAHGPVVVAGSTGSIPATAGFMEKVLALPGGFLVLPGLDRESDEEAWAAIGNHPEHPQHGLARLLARLGIERLEVRELNPPAHLQGRLTFLREALRPSSTAHRWAEFLEEARRENLKPGISVLEAEGPQEEAEAIALILREALEEEGRTAALVTPNTGIQNRVAILLRRWGIQAGRTGGRAHLVCGALAKCLADDDPLQLAFLLKQLCGSDQALLDCMALLEAAALRQSWAPASISGLAEAVARTRAALDRRELRHPYFLAPAQSDWEAVHSIAEGITTSAGYLLKPDAELPLAQWLEFHLSALNALEAALGSGAQAVQSSIREGADWLRQIGAEMRGRATSLKVAAQGYAALLTAIESERHRAEVDAGHRRLHFWTPLDARLQSADVMVLAGLNEGTWPAAAKVSPWLNLSEHQALNLPPPERRLGQSAHDFLSLASIGRVVLVRSKKVDGAPSRPSRWLSRILTLAEGMGEPLKDGAMWLGWVRQRAQPRPVQPCARPRPRPPLEVRPRRLSVTEVEMWIANPYAIYAKRILGLQELQQPSLGPDARDRGMLVHEALRLFTRRYPTELPDDTQAELMRSFDEAAADIGEHPRVIAFWRPRFQRFAAWFAESEPARRSGVVRVICEAAGERVFEAPAGSFTLTARADRIDISETGVATIYDYKTSDAAITEAIKHDAPQLGLEAALVRDGAFPKVPEGSVPQKLAFILTSGADAGGKERPVKDLDRAISEAESALRQQIARFDDPVTAYVPRRHSAFASVSRFDPYAHLARFDEWSAGIGEAP